MVHHAGLSTFGTFGLGWMRRCAALSIVCAAFLPPAPETAS
jgi:lysozyme family protein